MRNPDRKFIRWFLNLGTLLIVAQAAWFCGCAGMNYYPSVEDSRQKVTLEALINADPQVHQVMQGHRGWNKRDANKVRLSTGFSEWYLYYGLTMADPVPKDYDARRAMGLDAYGRIKDKQFTPDELDILAACIAAASKELGFSHEIEMIDQVASHTTRVIGKKGAWVRKK